MLQTPRRHRRAIRESVADPAGKHSLVTSFPAGGTRISAAATPRSIALVRAVAGAFGADNDMTIEQIDDLRLLVDSMCGVLFEQFGASGRATGRMTVVFSRQGTELTVEARRSSACEVGAPGAVSSMVLDALSRRWAAGLEGNEAVVNAAVGVGR